MMMMAPNPTPITPPSSSPTIVGSIQMASQKNQDQQQTPPPPPLGPLKCPRCDSPNTKFCYYNNYSLSQPRHFCKACKRYWTRGGTLRNVPVGGGCRKNKRANKKHLNAPAETPPTSEATKNPNPNNPLINLPTTSSELNSLIYASFPTAAAVYDDINNNNIEGLSSGLINVHQSSTNFLTNEYPSFKFGTQDEASFQQQDCINVNLGLKDVKVEGIESIDEMGNNINSDGILLWQADYYPFDQALNVAATDSTYMYWNPPKGGTCWPDAAANSSVTPLI